jgi:hypothetical protein
MPADLALPPVRRYVGSGAAKARAEAREIVRRLLDTDETIDRIRSEYHVSNNIILAILRAGSTPEQRRAARSRKMRAATAATQWRRGQRPWNAGLKGIHLSPSTEFRPGHLGGLAARVLRAIGTVVIRRARTGAPTRWIKVREDGPLYRRHIPLARYFWTRHHGPLPPGWIVMHRDGDSLNDDLDNLMAVDRPTAMRSIFSKPAAAAKRRRAASKTARRRWARYRRENAGRDEHRAFVARQVAFWECSACGHETPSRRAAPSPERCPKCGGGTFDCRRRRSAIGGAA